MTLSGQESRRRRRTWSFIGAVVLAAGLIVALRLVTSDGGDQAEEVKCGGESLQLRVASSPEKAGIVKQLAGEYSGRTVAGTCVDVLVQSKSSGAAMQALAGGWNEAADGPRPDVWTPAASGWATLLRQRLAAQDRPDVLLEQQPPSLANAPLVIAMPEPMAKALGWPGQGIGWRDLAALATDPAGWAKYGHPEWGAFRLGKTNPNLSTSGLNATIGTYFAATGTSSDLTAPDLDKPEVKSFVGGVEQSIVHYGDTTLTFLSNLLQADDRGAALSYVSAVAVEENSLIGYNQGNPTNDPAKLGQHPRPKVPVVAVYPADGTLNSDHPYAVLNWADDPRRQVAADFLAFLRSDDAQKRFLDQGFRSWENKPGPQATVDNGVLPETELNLIRPPSPPVLDLVLKSWAELRKKANVLLVVDVSGSMGDSAEGTGKSKMDLAKQAAVSALGEFGDRDQVGLWMFSTKLEGEQDHRELVPIGPVGKDGRRDALRSRLEGLTPQGGTGLYDTSLAAHEYLKARLAPDAINAVVVLTDGRNEDPGSLDLDNLISRLQVESGSETVRMFTIAYGGDADQDVLKRMAEATQAAEYDSSEPGTINQVFTAVISNF
ncbi:substrate-binding and VWA domain-containing protein [Amycolatopsis magusensis]|uniref:substrate-binding and VWA domain-containing protein n=1 Tax=Amycolatopsis magusensis TaxID=882444 RepID=UPI003C2FE79A